MQQYTPVKKAVRPFFKGRTAKNRACLQTKIILQRRSGKRKRARHLRKYAEIKRVRATS